MANLKQHMERTFRQLAADKGLEFNVKFDGKLPQTIRTDEKRLQQIVLNLLSNAFKFTAKGGVTLAVRGVEKGWSPSHPVLHNARRAIEISVTDTGIGISEDKQKLIFEPFHQADGTTSRKYGGTGLGLSISREIARLLGGELRVRSKPGEGSTFTLYIPMEAEAEVSALVAGTPARYDNSGALVPTALPTGFEVSDDRDDLGKDPFVLIVEDDPTFASILLDAAHDAGLKGVVSTAGAGTLKWRASSSRAPSRSTLASPTSTVSSCSTCSSMTRIPDSSDPRHFGRRPQGVGDRHGRLWSDRETGRTRRADRRLYIAPRGDQQAEAATSQAESR